MTIRIHVGSRKDETGQLVCFHCRLPHPVFPEIQEHFDKLAAGMHLDTVWECGACYLAHLRYMGATVPEQMRTDCAHIVPPFLEA